MSSPNFCEWCHLPSRSSHSAQLAQCERPSWKLVLLHTLLSVCNAQCTEQAVPNSLCVLYRTLSVCKDVISSSLSSCRGTSLLCKPQSKSQWALKTLWKPTYVPQITDPQKLPGWPPGQLKHIHVTCLPQPKPPVTFCQWYFCINVVSNCLQVTTREYTFISLYQRNILFCHFPSQPLC